MRDPLILNHKALVVFAPILILTGLLGFLIPAEKALMSGVASYNLFHIIAGLAGLAFVFSESQRLPCAFNLVFGAIDLYQAAASFLGLFPITHFQWKPADDVIHVLLGVCLAALGFWGLRHVPARKEG